MKVEKTVRYPEAFMSRRGQAAYITNCTRPEVSCSIAQLSQVKAEKSVDLSTAEIHVYADAPFANSKE